MSDKDFNEELKQITQNYNVKEKPKQTEPTSIGDEKWKRYKSQNKIKMGQAISHLKDIKKN